ncbi:MAG: two-component system response regulator [Rhodoferax sp.]
MVKKCNLDAVGMRVAVVDDVQMNVTLMQHLVRRLPEAQPVCFTEAPKALQWCLDNDPDLLVVDHMMPEMSGIELVQAFRQRYADTPVLMVTANSDVSLRHQALQSGVTDFLNKPVDAVEFVARARNMLALRRSHRHLASEVRRATAQLVAQERETIFCLARAAEYRDPETGAHIQRMAHFARLIARNLGCTQDEQDLILQAAPMHDVGKVGTPDAILLKPGRLTPDEFAIMKQHAAIGHRILSEHQSRLLQAAAEIAHTHHEKFDGSGYPRGLAGTAIPLFGRITAVADVFDALTSERPYKKAWSLEAASAFLREGAGQHFDPACVDAFFAVWDEVLAIRAAYQDEPDA